MFGFGDEGYRAKLDTDNDGEIVYGEAWAELSENSNCCPPEKRNSVLIEVYVAMTSSTKACYHIDTNVAVAFEQLEKMGYEWGG